MTQIYPTIRTMEANEYDCSHNGLMMDHKDNCPSFIKQEFITAENINYLFKKYNVPHSFDLLSIDVDFNDYWLWRAIESYSARVVIIEYNSSIQPNCSQVVKYEPFANWDKTNYFGASLLALSKLGKKKGYDLVGCDDNGINAFFIKSEIVQGLIKRTSPQCLRGGFFGDLSSNINQQGARNCPAWSGRGYCYCANRTPSHVAFCTIAFNAFGNCNVGRVVDSRRADSKCLVLVSFTFCNRCNNGYLVDRQRIIDQRSVGGALARQNYQLVCIHWRSRVRAGSLVTDHDRTCWHVAICRDQYDDLACGRTFGSCTYQPDGTG